MRLREIDESTEYSGICARKTGPKMIMLFMRKKISDLKNENFEIFYIYYMDKHIFQIDTYQSIEFLIPQIDH